MWESHVLITDGQVEINLVSPIFLIGSAGNE